MKSLNEFLNEAGGANAGKLELSTTSVDTALAYAENLFAKHGIDLYKAIPNFVDNYKTAQRKSTMGWTRRRDMPVISSRDVDDFQDKLRQGELTGNRVRARMKRIRVGDLNPIQKQIYVDKSLQTIIDNGVAESRQFFNKKTKFIGSSDDYILDGHHRFLSAVLIDPRMNVSMLEIDLPISKLLPVSVEYSDSIGNERNR